MIHVSAMELAMLRNMIIKTGKPLKKWIEIVKEENFVERKDIVRFLIYPQDLSASLEDYNR